MKSWYRIISGLLVPVFAYLSIWLTDAGFSEIEDFRKLERIPPTAIEGSVGGEVQLSGYAAPYRQTIKTPYTQTRVVYYRYLLEEEYRDSDGDSRWRTVKDETRSVDFLLEDSTGSALLKTAGFSGSNIDWITRETAFKRAGKLRHTEWTIAESDPVNLIGWMQNQSQNQPARVVFTAEGDYVPIISTDSIAAAQSSMGADAMLSIWGGVSLAVLMCVALMYTLRRHRVVTFLAMMTLITSLLLLQLGYQSMKLNVAGGAERVRSHMLNTHKAISDVLADHGLEYSPNDHAFDVGDAKFNGLSQQQKRRLDNWRITAYEVRQRYLLQVGEFPEIQYARAIAADKIPGVALTAELQLEVNERMKDLQFTKTERNKWLILAGLVIMAIFAWLGFRTIRFKRMQENIIASKVAGVTYGLAETNGKLTPLVKGDDEQILTGPLSGARCCWYHYIVEEKRGSGKNARWHTITDEYHTVDFRCEDRSGSIYVDSDDAEFITRHKESSRSGRYRYKEESIRPGDELYIFGEARITREVKGDELCFTKPDDSPFIVSNYNEDDVKFYKGSKGLLLLSIGISLMFLCAIWMAGNEGNFSTIDFLLASLAAPALSFIMMIMLMYNDLVFLRQRYERNFANIQVALKMRFDLTPSLVKVVKRYLKHEQELQQRLTKLRSASFGNASGSVTESVNADIKEHGALYGFARQRISLESHPELKGNKAIADLHNRLVHLENEIELIREGFNNSVTEYNTRIALFPDVFIAKIFRFKKKKLLSL